jgi:uncharacterized protein (TIRG00374 family)
VKANAGKMFRWVLSAAIIVFLVIFARKVDWAGTWNLIRHASLPLLVVTMAANIASIAVKGVRWWVFLRPIGVRSLALSMRATLAGAGLNNVLVANGGDAARVVFVSRACRVPSSVVLATLALERLFDPIGFVILLVYAGLVYDLPPALARWQRPAEIGLVVVIALLGFFVYRTNRSSAPAEGEQVRELAGIWSKVRAYFARFAATAKEISNGPRFAAALALSMIAWLGQLVTFVYAARAAHVDISVAGSLVALLATNLGLLLRATPGNVGFFQFMYALTAGQFGVQQDQAVAVSLLIQALQVLPLTLLGVALAPEFIFKRGRAQSQ